MDNSYMSLNKCHPSSLRGNTSIIHHHAIYRHAPLVVQEVPTHDPEGLPAYSLRQLFDIELPCVDITQQLRRGARV
jgi:hypothetical protein